MSSQRSANILFTFVLAAMSLFSTVAMSQQAIKIAVVNLDYLVTNSPQGKALHARLEQLQKQVVAEIENKNKGLVNLREKMARGANSLSEDQLLELNKQFEDIQIDINRYKDDKQREGQKMQAEGLKQIEIILEPVFKKIKEERGYDLILNDVPGVVIMASDQINITQDILDLLNNQ